MSPRTGILPCGTLRCGTLRCGTGTATLRQFFLQLPQTSTDPLHTNSTLTAVVDVGLQSDSKQQLPDDDRFWLREPVPAVHYILPTAEPSPTKGAARGSGVDAEGAATSPKHIIALEGQGHTAGIGGRVVSRIKSGVGTARVMTAMEVPTLRAPRDGMPQLAAILRKLQRHSGTFPLPHVGGQNVFYNPFTAPPTNESAFYDWTIGATYYAALIVAEVLGKTNTSQLLDLQGNDGNIFTPQYAVYENGNIAKVALFNFVTDPSGTSDYTATITLNGGTVPSSVRVKYFLSDSVSTKNNITWAGQTFGTSHNVDGRLLGALDVRTIECDTGANTCLVPVPAPAFALVFLSDAAWDDAGDVQPTTYSTSAYTKTQNTARIDATALAASNGNSGKLWDSYIGSTSRGSSSAARGSEQKETEMRARRDPDGPCHPKVFDNLRESAASQTGLYSMYSGKRTVTGGSKSSKRWAKLNASAENGSKEEQWSRSGARHSGGGTGDVPRADGTAMKVDGLSKVNEGYAIAGAGLELVELTVPLRKSPESEPTLVVDPWQIPTTGAVPVEAEPGSANPTQVQGSEAGRYKLGGEL
ncbi:hypothetical protein FB451DRAFT_1360450 [Mycena latifolia]|nr:hypothetical protein FB451DRAFT_1360450 [Mycena latifolia]